MPKSTIIKLLVAALVLSAMVGPAHAEPARLSKAEIGFVPVGEDITLRRLVIRSPHAKATVLFLHGFPETLFAWNAVSLSLADEFEVHAFDWPGFGQSSRPSPDRFGYAPRDYARVLKAYIDKAGIDRSGLIIYATDIGALPALLLALDEPGIARAIIVGDFAPFDRPAYMYESLQALKAKPSSDIARAKLNSGRDELLENIFRRGLPKEARFELSPEFKDDLARGWRAGQMTPADAFYHYYAHFTRDQNDFEAQITRLKTPVKVIWGAEDVLIKKEMGAELADKVGAELTILPGVGHFPHLQAPRQTIAEVRASLR